jgi:phosphoribosylaminoimidazole-succinocarboxamide synthase
LELLYKGKTKNVYDLKNGHLLLEFKDDGTVDDKGNFDPGGNAVGVTVKGMGDANLRLTDFFFTKINASGFNSHYVSADLEKVCMTVKPAKRFGKGLEAICRFKATGSFMRRYSQYATERQSLPALVEITIKDDERGDPFISKESLLVLGIMNAAEYDELVDLTQKISTLVKDELSKKGAELYDIKLEFGRSESDRKIILIDEISGGCMRVYKDGKIINPLEIARLILS